jgi:hypothetical protein
MNAKPPNQPRPGRPSMQGGAVEILPPDPCETALTTPFLMLTQAGEAALAAAQALAKKATAPATLRA